MTEKFWQQEKERLRLNKLHPDIQQTYNDLGGKVLNKDFRELYFNCQQADMNLKAFEKEDEISVEDMAMLICRDAGCDLQFCQAGLEGPNKNPFKDCDEQYKKFLKCQEQEKKRYFYDNHSRSMKDHLFYMINQKKDKINKTNEMKEQQTENILNIENGKGNDTKENKNPNRPKVVKDEKL